MSGMLRRPTMSFLGVIGLVAAGLAALVLWWPGGTGERDAQAAVKGDEFVLSGQDLVQALNVASSVERPLIADGVITRAEYQAAVDATVTCLETHGFQVVHLTENVQGLFGSYGRLGANAAGPAANSRGVIEYAATGGSKSVEANSAMVASCKQGSAVIEALWQQQAAPTEAERQAMRDAMATCLLRRGYEVAEHPSEEQLLRVVAEPPVTDAARDAHRDFATCDMAVAKNG